MIIIILIRDITTMHIVMANPNPKNLNVANEGVPEEDLHYLLNYDEEEDQEMDIEEEEPEEEPVEEPEPLAGHGDQFDAHPNPQPGNMNGWVDDDDDDVEEEEDEENEDADMEEDEDAEIIFPYEAAIGTGSQRPFAVRNFPMGFYEAGESSTARDPHFVEAIRRHERIREAESETSKTEIALLRLEAKIGKKMEREILIMI
nr:hypothetical protein [Tanacetum cinerariifolium]